MSSLKNSWVCPRRASCKTAEPAVTCEVSVTGIPEKIASDLEEYVPRELKEYGLPSVQRISSAMDHVTRNKKKLSDLWVAQMADGDQRVGTIWEGKMDQEAETKYGKQNQMLTEKEYLVYAGLVMIGRGKHKHNIPAPSLARYATEFTGKFRSAEFQNACLQREHKPVAINPEQKQIGKQPESSAGSNEGKCKCKHFHYYTADAAQEFRRDLEACTDYRKAQILYSKECAIIDAEHQQELKEIHERSMAEGYQSWLRAREKKEALESRVRAACPDGKAHRNEQDSTSPLDGEPNLTTSPPDNKATGSGTQQRYQAPRPPSGPEGTGDWKPTSNGGWSRMNWRGCDARSFRQFRNLTPSTAE
jgi:hypothetical protein